MSNNQNFLTLVQRLNHAVLDQQRKMLSVFGNNKGFSLEIFISSESEYKLRAEARNDAANLFTTSVAEGDTFRGWPLFVFSDNRSADITTPEFRIYTVTKEQEL